MGILHGIFWAKNGNNSLDEMEEGIIYNRERKRE